MLNRVCDFLGVEGEEIATIPSDNSRPFVRDGVRARTVGPVIRAHLEDIDLLERITGESFEEWKTYREGSSFESRRTAGKDSSKDKVRSG